MSQLKEMIAYNYGIPTEHQVRAMAKRRVSVEVSRSSRHCKALASLAFPPGSSDSEVGMGNMLSMNICSVTTCVLKGGMLSLLTCRHCCRRSILGDFV